MLLIGTPVPAWIQRLPGPGESGLSTPIPHLTVRALSIGGELVELVPVSSSFVADTFGATAVQPMLAVADWQGGFAGDFPIKPRDFLVLPPKPLAITTVASSIDATHFSVQLGRGVGFVPAHDVSVGGTTVMLTGISGDAFTVDAGLVSAPTVKTAVFQNRECFIHGVQTFPGSHIAIYCSAPLT